jgi:hypothetical protein
MPSKLMNFPLAGGETTEKEWLIDTFLRSVIMIEPESVLAQRK